MKTHKVLGALFLASAFLVVAILLWRSGSRLPHLSANPPGTASPAGHRRTDQNAAATNVAGLPEEPLSEAPNALQRLARLQRVGQVPENADLRDWSLAQRTTWWGKRFDPKEFWKGRTVWLDRSAAMAAHRQGRLYPPVPYNDPRFASRSDVDESIMPGVDSSDIHFRLSDKENAFWDTFAKTHPSPPERIAGTQQQLANQILGSRYGFEHGGSSAHTTQARLDGMDSAARSEVQALGYPPEAFTDEALHWAYVLEKRAEYEQQYIRTHTENTIYSSNFLARVWVDPKLITDPLTDEQLKAANAWKIAYLQRLRKENTDESYINAYLEAWNLSPAAVFGGTNGP